jgi:lysozyme family protein
MNFDKAFQTVIGHEGNYVNHPDDPGGETKFGISKRAYPNLDIKNLTLDQAKEIYQKDYWTACRCDEMPEPVKYPLFDGAVNSGVKQSIRWLQEAVNSKPDGVIGPNTLLAVKFQDSQVVTRKMIGARLSFMTKLNNWNSFGRGWAARIANILETA